jgi:hypothetical protein
MKELDNIQIDKFFVNNPFYGGCFSKDEVTRINGEQKKFYILNLDEESGPGTHWVLLSMIDPKTGIYFDSFSCPPPEIVYLFMKKNRPENVYNNGIIQKLSSENCGYYCCRCGYDLSHGEHYLDLLDEYSVNESENEKIITTWSKSVGLSH